MFVFLGLCCLLLAASFGLLSFAPSPTLLTGHSYATSSSCRSMSGMPAVMGKRRPVSGQMRAPSKTWTSNTSLCTSLRKASSALVASSIWLYKPRGERGVSRCKGVVAAAAYSYIHIYTHIPLRGAPPCPMPCWLPVRHPSLTWAASFAQNLYRCVHVCVC